MRRIRLSPLQRAIMNVLTEPVSIGDVQRALQNQGIECGHPQVRESMHRLEQRSLLWRPYSTAPFRLTHTGQRVVAR